MTTIRSMLLAACCVTLGLSLPACKIVKTTKEAGKSTAPAAGAGGDEARMAALVDDSFISRLVPHVDDTAVELTTLRAAIDADIEAAGAEHGHRGAGDGAAWNFAVRGSGVVVEANRASRAAKMTLDTDGDGGADVTLQLGPVFKGTALRDIAPFYNFSDFRDQIEFAKLGRALNDRVPSLLVLPEGELAGRQVTFVGVFAAKKATDPWLVTPVSLEVAP